MNRPDPTPPWQIEVFYDQECPLCRREIALLQRWDRHGRIRFVNLHDAVFDEQNPGRSFEELMAQMHGRLPDGTWVTGVEVFRRMYAAVGFGFLVALSRCPGVAQLLDVGYAWFARNRLKWTGRCDAGTCRRPTLRT